MTAERTSDPLVYRPSRRWRLALAFLGAFPLVVGLAGFWYFGTGQEDQSTMHQASMITLSLGLAALGAYTWLIPRFSGTVWLCEKEIVFQGFFRDVRIARDAINGYSYWQHPSTKGVELHIAGTGAVQKKRFSLLFVTDKPFLNWFTGIPKITENAFSEGIKQIKQDPRLGRNPRQRLLNNARARKTARKLEIGVGILIAWAWFFPRPYSLVLALLAAIPIAVLLLCRSCPQRFSIANRPDGGARANHVGLLFLPAGALALRALWDSRLTDALQLILPSLLGTLAWVVLVIWAEPEYRKFPKRLLVVAFIGAVYSCATIALINALLDDSAGTPHTVHVSDRQRSTGRNSNNTLNVYPCGPHPYKCDSYVSDRDYAAIEAGEEICLYTFPGALGIERFHLDLRGPCQ